MNVAPPMAAAAGANPAWRWLQVAMATASLLAPLNSSMIAVALPAIRSEFHVGVGPLTWLVSSYLIAVAVSQPVGGRLGDAAGHLRVVTAGLVAFIVCSAAAAMSWNFASLVVFRSLQGIGAAFIMPNAVAYLRRQAAPGQLGSVLGTNGAAISAGAALGPIVGGLLLVLGGWRWLFLANIPVSLVALGMVLRARPDRGGGLKALRLDVVTLIALAGAFAGMTLLGSAVRLHSVAIVAAGLVVMPASLAVYALRYRQQRRAIVDLRLFTRRNYAAAAAGTALSNLVMYAALIAMPVYLGDVRGVGDGAIGALLFSMSIAMVAIAPFAGRSSDRIGSRPPIIAGAVALLVAAATLALIIGGPAVAMLAVPLVLIGVGLGIAQAAQSAAALRAWPPEMAGSAAGTFSMMRYVGSVTGTAIIAAVLGAHPGEGSFRLLFAILAGFAAINVVAALSIARDLPAEATADGGNEEESRPLLAHGPGGPGRRAVAVAADRQVP
jgi:MFS family permease